MIYFRKAVPKDLWIILGRREIKVSLRSRDHAVIRRRHAELTAHWEGFFDDLRRRGSVEVDIGFAPKDWAANPLADQTRIARPQPVSIPSLPLQDASSTIDPLNLFDRMARERQFAPATVKRHRAIIEAVAKDHPDLRSITPEWCVRWKDDLIASGLSARTVQYANLAALRNLMGFAIANRYIDTNPLDGLGIRVKAAKRNRVERGFTDAEARIVLKATTMVFGDILPADQKRARRWLPWICNYGGTRIGEAAQLRKEDFVQEEGVWIMLIRPDAGSVKSGKARRVPVHPNLIEQGLIDMVRTAAPGYLFADPTRRRSQAGNEVMHKKTAENLARWVRSLGLDDPELQPNHGWRHRFKTVARRVKMDPGARDYLQGHAEHNEAESYGDQPAPALLEQLSLIPAFMIEGC